MSEDTTNNEETNEEVEENKPIHLDRFEIPNRLVKNEDTETDTYAHFTAEPFERGFGHTIGNSLRRVLLSSLEGAAITSVRIAGVQHEFSSLAGVVEDVTDIILNLKKVKFRHHDKEPRVLVTRVKYGVGQTRVGQMTDFDKLELDIWTDGRLEPAEALLQASSIMRHHLDVFVNYDDNAPQQRKHH